MPALTVRVVDARGPGDVDEAHAALATLHTDEARKEARDAEAHLCPQEKREK
jgi:hypothetical protein